MLSLPDEKRGLLGLGPRKFKTKAAEKEDRSIWTDTPADKERKALVRPRSLGFEKRKKKIIFL
jgi:hypothetical protein